MLEVRRVRIGDVTLRGMYDSKEPPKEGVEGVLMKAETYQPALRPDWARGTLDWASLHMNLDIVDSQPPGKELCLVVTDDPPGNAFKAKAGIGDNLGYHNRLVTERRGRVNLVGPEGFSFVLSGEAKDGRDDINVLFDREQAAALVQLLVYWWFRPFV